MFFGKSRQKIPLDSPSLRVQNLMLRPWIWLCCWLSGYLLTTEPFYILTPNKTPKNAKYSRNDMILKTPENEKRCFMGKRLTNTFNIKKKTQFCNVATLPILQRLRKSYKKWLLTHIRDVFRGKTAKSTLNILKKWHHFERWQKLPFCKGCS